MRADPHNAPLLLINWCFGTGLEYRPASRRTVGSGIGPDPKTSDSSCSEMSPLSLGSPAVAPNHQHQVVHRLNSLLGSASRGSMSSARWWSGFVRSSSVSASSFVSKSDSADGEQSRTCRCPGVLACSCAAILLALILTGLLLWQMEELQVLQDDVRGRNSSLSDEGVNQWRLDTS